MNREPNKPIKADELTEKELDGVVGGKEVEGGSAAQGAIGVWAGFADLK